jgi:hypothetical protein
VDYIDLDIAVNYYDWAIRGKARKRQTGQVRTNGLIQFFKKHKPETGRGCNKAKESLLHRLAIEFKMIEVVNSHYTPGQYSKVYRLGASHPDYSDVYLSVWDKMAL